MNHPHGMVPRRAHQGEASTDPFFEHLDPDGLCASGTDEMRFGGHPRLIRHAEMHPANVPHVRQVRLELDDPFQVQDSFFEHLVLGVEEAFLALWMGGTDGPVIGGEKKPDRRWIGGCNSLKGSSKTSRFPSAGLMAAVAELGGDLSIFGDEPRFHLRLDPNVPSRGIEIPDHVELELLHQFHFPGPFPSLLPGDTSCGAGRRQACGALFLSKSLDTDW